MVKKYLSYWNIICIEIININILLIIIFVLETGRKKFPNSYNDAVMKFANSWIRHAKDRLRTDI